MRLIDAEAILKHSFDGYYREGDFDVFATIIPASVIENAPTIEAKPVVRAHWISASWEEDEEEGIENTYSDEFICSNCKEHLYFPDAIEKEDIGFSFCPYCGAQMDEGVKIPVISMEDVPKIMEEMEK